MELLYQLSYNGRTLWELRHFPAEAVRRRRAN
ncbi:MAG: hypothetical protein UY73_C0012G0008 [Parcubacteria group bacterium GW2011_GWA2_52_8]|nr:MAG: hypothetical protein UY73_C0012G0008 [Parcubacteria group bacterium GW2011_GWA2_52_8]